MVRYGPWELRDGPDYLRFEDIFYSPEDATAGYIENTTCHIRVLVGEFSGVATWDLDWQDILTFVSDMKALYSLQKKEVLLDDLGLGSTLHVQAANTGKVTITGDLHDATRLYQVLHFVFSTDLSEVNLFLCQVARQLRNIPDT